MEENEKKYITKYLPQLIQWTICNPLLLAQLRAKNILTQQECQNLETREIFGGKIAQANLLYEILFTKSNSYDILLSALSDPEINQTGAVQILENGKIQQFDLNIAANNENDPIVQATRKFVSPLGRLKDLVQNEKIPLVIISTVDISLTTERIQAERIPYQFHLFVSMETLLQNFGGLQPENCFLIAMHGKKRKALEDVIQNIKELANTTKQCIVMTTENLETVNEIVSNTNSIYSKIIQDDLKWSQLSTNFQATLLERLVKFQDEQMTLNDLLTKNDEKRKLLLEMLETKLLAKLINDEIPVFCNNTLENRPTPPFYIHRKIISRSLAISKDILNIDNSQPDTSFAITGMMRHNLTNLKAGRVSTSQDQIRQGSEIGITAKFIVLETEKHFDLLSKRISKCSPVKNLHFLQFHRKHDHFEWIKSVGEPDCLNLIQKYIIAMTDDQREQFSLGEQDFIKDLIEEPAGIDKKPAICISDNPGMGKTTLMAHIGSELLKSGQPQKFAESLTFVQYFVMTDLMRNLEEMGIRDEQKLNETIILEILINRMTNTQVVHHIFLKMGSKCELMLDGFDEVLPHQAKLAVKFISIIRHKLGITSGSEGPTFRIWLTTRPVLLQLVEQTLGVLGYNMLPFDESDQKMFLKMYWIQDAKKRGIQLDPKKLDQFSNGSLETMKRVSGKLSKFEMEMTGLPLQCLLLAQICEGSVNYECSVDGNFEEDPDPDRFAIKNVADLYKRVMDKKLEIFLNRESSNSHLESHLSKNNKQVMKRIHMKLALELLFPEWLDKFQIIFLHEFQITPEELSIYGFVSEYPRNGQPVFVHRTYAEYFVALFCVEIGTSERLIEGFSVTGNMAKFYLDEVLATNPEDSVGPLDVAKLAVFQMPVVNYFIDELLEMKNSTENSIPRYFMNQIQTNLKELSSGQFETNSSKILACITNDRPNITKLLVNSLDENGKQIWLKNSQIFHTKMVYAAALRGNKIGLQILCELLEKFDNQDVSKLSYNLARNPLLAAALMGNLESVEYLVLEKDFKPEVWATKDQNILYHVVKESNRESERTIENRINIINFLVTNQGPLEGDANHILEHIDFLGRTPLLAEGAHIKLRMTLISAGANIMAFNRDGNYVIHMLGDFTGITPKIYHEFLELIEQTVKENSEDPEETLEILLKSKNGPSVEGHMYTPSWFWDNDTALHLAIGHLEVMEETFDLFGKYRFDWDEQNGEDYTLVHVAVKFGRSLRLIKKLIDDLGAEWTIMNLEGRTAFMEGCWVGHLEFVEWICEEYEFDIDLGDWNGRTALHYGMKAPSDKRFDVVRILLENGAEPNSLNQKGETPLVHSLYEGHGISVELLRFLKEKGSNILGVEDEDKSEVVKALFYMANSSLDGEHNLCGVLEYLIEEGADLKGPEGKCNYLVHKAALNGWLKGLKILESKIEKTEFYEMMISKDGDKCTPVYYAVKGQSLEVLKWLVKKVGENILEEPCKVGGARSIHVCARLGWMEGLQLLVEKYKVNLEVRDDDGSTVIHEAYCTDGVRSQVVGYLEEKMGGACGPVSQLKNFKNETPQEYEDRDVEEESKNFALWHNL